MRTKVLSRPLSAIALLSIILAGGCDLSFLNLWPELSDRIDPAGLPRLVRFDEAGLETYPGVYELSADLDAYGYQVALMYLRDHSVATRLGYYRSTFWNFLGGDPVMMAEDATGASADPTAYATNVQVQGVDELDLVKSDGTFVFVAEGKEILVIDAAGVLRDRMAVFSDTAVQGLLIDPTGKLLALGSPLYDDDGLAATRLALYSIGGDGNLGLIESRTVSGSCVDGRLSGGAAYLSFSADVDYSILIDALVGMVPIESSVGFDDGHARVQRRLETLIPRWRNAVLSDLLSEGGVENVAVMNRTLRILDPLDGNDSVPYPEIYQSFVSLMGLSLSSGLEPVSAAGVFSAAYSYSSYLYANGETAVIANPVYSFDGGNDWSQYTQLYSFRTSDGAVTPMAAGSVPGYPISQFSLDVYDSRLRTATCTSSRWTIDPLTEAWTVTSPSESRVDVLEAIGADLEVVGSVAGIGAGESLYAVRFLGDLGLVVTFLRTDPLFTLDLSDPYHPVLAGELEVEGYSTYLHPMADNKVLAVGEGPGSSGMTLQLSIFDIASLATPSLVDRYTFEAGAGSYAEWDHHAFRYVASRDLVILPTYSWGSDTWQSGFSVLGTNGGTDLALQGAIIDPAYDWNRPWTVDEDTFVYLPSRSVLLGDTLITMAASHIRGTRIGDLATLWDIDL